MANTFLYAKGYDLGKSFVEKNLIKDARAIKFHGHGLSA